MLSGVLFSIGVSPESASANQIAPPQLEHRQSAEEALHLDSSRSFHFQTSSEIELY
jgi:hypothetical protein